MLYFIAVSNSRLGSGFITDNTGHYKLQPDVRIAKPYTTFAAADAAAKLFGFQSYAILSNCIG